MFSTCHHCATETQCRFFGGCNRMRLELAESKAASTKTCATCNSITYCTNAGECHYTGSLLDGRPKSNTVAPKIPVTSAPPTTGINPKDAIGLTKPQLHLLPAVATIYGAMALQAGGYEPFNWRKDAVRLTVYINAMKRHLAAVEDGEDMDRKSGLPHMAHILANAAIILDAAECFMLVDDRYGKGKAADLLAKMTEAMKDG